MVFVVNVDNGAGRLATSPAARVMGSDRRTVVILCWWLVVEDGRESTCSILSLRGLSCLACACKRPRKIHFLVNGGTLNCLV